MMSAPTRAMISWKVNSTRDKPESVTIRITMQMPQAGLSTGLGHALLCGSFVTSSKTPARFVYGRMTDYVDMESLAERHIASKARSWANNQF